ncbi:hypothetical protein ABGB09_21515 [Streptomyces sp. B8F3]
MPNEDYTFAIERDATGYTLEASRAATSRAPASRRSASTGRSS